MASIKIPFSRILLLVAFMLLCGCTHTGVRQTQSPTATKAASTLKTLETLPPEFAFESLPDLVGKNLSELKISELTNVWQLVSEAPGLPFEYDEKKHRIYIPRFIQPFDAGGSTNWVFVASYPGMMIPDVSIAHVQVFDRNWKRLCVETFPTGYRAFQRTIEVQSTPSMGQDLLRFRIASAGPFMSVNGGESRPAFEQGKYQFQYYGFIDDRIALVRIEDDTKRVVGNSSRPPRSGTKTSANRTWRNRP